MSQEDKVYGKMFVAIPILLAIFGVIKSFNYYHLGYLILASILIIKYFLTKEEESD